MGSAIEDRRSVRRFSERALSRGEIRELLQSGILAPSSKNRQPWKFVVVEGKAKWEMLEAFARGIAREESGDALLPESGRHLAAARVTLRVLEQAPVVIFVLNPLGRGLFEELTREERVYEVCNLQSASAAIENMLIAAAERGLGGLWICDIYFAYRGLCEWLNTEGELLAAVAFGHPEETPAARPRRPLDEVVEWRS